MGFWWWRMPDQIDKYYESIEDLETKSPITLERSPSLKIDWGKNRVLKAADLNRVKLSLIALPGPNEQQNHAPFNYYIGGLTFLALNDLHWQCESTIFGNFFECFLTMANKIGDWKQEDSIQPILEEYIRKLLPVENDYLSKFIQISLVFEAKSPEKVTITLQEVSFIKLICDYYFSHRFRPAMINEIKRRK